MPRPGRPPGPASTPCGSSTFRTNSAPGDSSPATSTTGSRPTPRSPAPPPDRTGRTPGWSPVPATGPTSSCDSSAGGGDAAERVSQVLSEDAGVGDVAAGPPARGFPVELQHPDRALLPDQRHQEHAAHPEPLEDRPLLRVRLVLIHVHLQ